MSANTSIRDSQVSYNGGNMNSNVRVNNFHHGNYSRNASLSHGIDGEKYEKTSVQEVSQIKPSVKNLKENN